MEEQLEREDVVELDPRHAPNEAVRHALVLPDVHVLDVVELRVGRVFDVEVILARRIVVHVQHDRRAGILPREAHVVELTEAEVYAGERHLLSLKSKVENDFQGAGVGDEDRQVLAGDVGAEAEQETFLVGGGEADTDALSDRRSPGAEEVVLDDGIRAQVDADL